MKEPESLAYRLLYLEQKLESYARLHAQELADMRKVLQELKDELFTQHQRSWSAPDAPLDDGHVPPC